MELDVALAHPWAKDILLRAATTGGSAILRREQIKENKSREERLPGGYSPSVVPLVFKHFGQWGVTMDYLKVLSTLLRDEHRRSNISAFTTHWRRCFSIQLQCCNASVIAMKLFHITGGHKSNVDIHEFQFCLR